MHTSPLTFARFVAAAENRAGLLAAQTVAECVCSRRLRRRHNPLLLHGPSGTGKSHLALALVQEVTGCCSDLTVTALSSAAWKGEGTEPEDQALRGCDLLVVEDLQYLPPQAAERLVQLIDFLRARGRQIVLTANAGPQQLGGDKRLPARLTSRLAAGLVVPLAPLQAPGRLALLEAEARRRRLAVAAGVLPWLAEHMTGSARQLLGALTRLEALARQRPTPLSLAEVAGHFREQALATALTIEQIARRVGGYYQVEPALLQSRRRASGVLWPRQVGMYLARKLTTLSLAQIGAYFGGRDHSTVLHACRKVETALTDSPVLSGAVRQLHADLA
jgi:chromosomal replication initiator protein